MAPAAWAGNKIKKVTGEAYGRLSAEFSAYQQDTSAISSDRSDRSRYFEITGNFPSGSWNLGDFGLARRSL